jgi:hypothetical protein
METWYSLFYGTCNVRVNLRRSLVYRAFISACITPRGSYAFYDHHMNFVFLADINETRNSVIQVVRRSHHMRVLNSGGSWPSEQVGQDRMKFPLSLRYLRKESQMSLLVLHSTPFYSYFRLILWCQEHFKRRDCGPLWPVEHPTSFLRAQFSLESGHKFPF